MQMYRFLAYDHKTNAHQVAGLICKLFSPLNFHPHLHISAREKPSFKYIPSFWLCQHFSSAEVPLERYPLQMACIRTWRVRAVVCCLFARGLIIRILDINYPYIL